MKLTHVWVVERGEINEGGRVVHVARTKDVAERLEKDIQRDRFFHPGIDFTRITRMAVVGRDHDEPV